MLNISKDFGETVLTYLYDAKYRVINDKKLDKDFEEQGIYEAMELGGGDYPPEDAINQMHRYRDAIYYREHSSSELKKEVIGGYILFPGDGRKADIEVSKFYKTISEVNIGALPLRPKDKENRALLVQFIESLIGRATTEILDRTIPQKGLYYTPEEPKDALYMILALDKDVNPDMTAVVEGRAATILMGRLGMDETKDIGAVRYIAPIVPGGHIEGYYRVRKVNLARVEDAAYPVRIKFDVCEWIRLPHPVRHGTFPIVFRGLCKTREQFFAYCREKSVMSG